MTNYSQAAEKLRDSVLDSSTHDREPCEHDNSKTRSFVHFKTEAIRDKREGYEALSNIISDAKMSEGCAYTWVCAALSDIIDNNIEDSDEFDELVNTLEGDINTSDLTEWLASSNYHVNYLTEAMSEFSDCDGFHALAIAQAMAMQEIYRDVWSVVADLTEKA